jgi:voltage-gated potassium channel
LSALNGAPRPLWLDLAAQLLARLVWPLILVGVVFVAGSAGFFALGQGKWPLFDCVYMVAITLTTVGYGEVLENMSTGARVLAMALMFVGMGVVLYAVSAVTAFIVEKNLSKILRERRMNKQLAALTGHIIVCGLGQTGLQVLRELTATRHTAVGIDLDPARVERAKELFPETPFLQGDASQEETLRRAGVEQAMGLMALLPEDSLNMLITVEARFIDKDIRIVARASTNQIIDKFYRAGADYVVNPAFIGGMRMASMLIRPNVVTFLDRMLRGQGPSIRVEEVAVAPGSPLDGASLEEAQVYDKTGLRVVALRHPGQEEFVYNPADSERIPAGSVLIVIADPDRAEVLRRLCRA